VPIDQLDLEAEDARRVHEFYGADAADPSGLSAMIKDDEKCIRCGLCAVRCPTDAMTMEVFFYEEHEAVS
jgi:ferredoxin